MDELFSVDLQAAFGVEEPNLPAIEKLDPMFLPHLEGVHLLGMPEEKIETLQASLQPLPFDIRELLMALASINTAVFQVEPERMTYYVRLFNRAFLQLWFHTRKRYTDPVQQRSVMRAWATDALEKVRSILNLLVLRDDTKITPIVFEEVQNEIQENSNPWKGDDRRRVVEEICPLLRTFLANIYVIGTAKEVTFALLSLYGVLTSCAPLDELKDMKDVLQQTLCQIEDNDNPLSMAEDCLVYFSADEDNRAMHREYERGESSLPMSKRVVFLERQKALREELTLIEELPQETMHPPVSFQPTSTFLVGGTAVIWDSLRWSPFSLASPKRILEMILPYMSVILSSTSDEELRYGIALLGALLPRIPRYTFHFEGEKFSTEEFLLNTDYVSQFHTETFKTFFDTCKQLIGVSSVHKEETLRTASRSCAMDLIWLLQEETRLRVLFSLIHLCPYPSVSAFLLRTLLDEWQAYNASQPPSTQPSAPCYEVEFPTKFMECVQSFVLKVKAGNAEFFEPLVASLNFLLLFLSSERKKSNGTSRLQWREDGKLAVVRKADLGWSVALSRFKNKILPSLREWLSPDPNTQVLSPLDVFTLESLVEKLSNFFAVDEN
ncbi:Uncharacterised protein family, YAP/Alf4/glomulin, putative [Angomonas deanei]|uniref:Uncharacterized protein n=1 Tax=Angomonas deanei TaxID=59799 RepID=A0A7G2CG37_9TRYP|nr:Uncharacterised protein family, YAP/Alf4/glomulin, putative [Angomonas deanei]